MNTDEKLDNLKLFLLDGLKNKTLTSCSRWAARRRIMGGDLGGNKPYSDKYHPWCRGMHDSWSTYNYAMKGAQLGVTEVAVNRALYTIDRLKRNVLYVLPTGQAATDFSQARFGSALSLSPYLGSLFTNTNSVKIKQAGANTLYIRGSRGRGDLVSVDVSEMILDEVDRMDQDKIWLALERLSGQKTSKHVWGISTPTIPNVGIHKLYQGSTQEHFMFKCPSCRRHIELKWPESVVIVGEGVNDRRCHESYLQCYECKVKLEHEDKPNFLKDAYWESFDKSADPDVRGFHISQLYSFTVDPGNLVIAHMRGFGDELANIEFHNSKLGLPFIGDGAKVDEGMLKKCIGYHNKTDNRPNDGRRIITLGVDRGKWNYAEVCEYFIDEWTLDITANSTAKVLFEMRFHEEEFDIVMNQLMIEWQVRACVLDADPGPMQARQFARRFPGFVWLCRYRRGQTAKEISIDDQDDAAPMATVDRAAWLSASLGRFKAATPRITLPQDVSKEYMDHIMSLVSTYIRDEPDRSSKRKSNEIAGEGQPLLDFVKTGPDHFAHARNYAEIALPLVAAQQMSMDITKFN